jgi:hypothetical protein
MHKAWLKRVDSGGQQVYADEVPLLQHKDPPSDGLAFETTMEQVE